MTKRDKVTVDNIIGLVHTDEMTNSVEEVRKLRGRENRAEKRVKLHIKWYNIEKTEGEATLTDNGQPLIQTERITDARLLKNILNDLYNENEQLRKENKGLQGKASSWKITASEQMIKQSKLMKENEQLKQTVSDWSGSYDELFEDIKRLEEENEHIKNTIQEAYNNERTHIGKSVIQQLLEQL